MKHILLAIVVGCITQVCLAQTPFEHTYGGPETDIGFSVQQTADGGFALFGITWNTNGMSADMYLLKTDEAGVEQWSQTYGTVNLDLGYCARQTSDGGFILCGMVAGFENDSLTLVRTDAQGAILWMNRYPGTLGRDIGYAVEQTSSGGFVVCGFTQGTGIEEDVYLVRTDADGAIIWSRSVDLGGSEVGWSLRQTADDGIIVLANSFTFADTDGDIHLLRFDQNGDTLWTRTITNPGPDETHGLAITNDGGFIIAGGNGYPSRDIFLVRTDANGQEQWRRTYASAGDNMALDIQVMDDGGFIACGRKENLLTDNIEMHLFRTDGDGNLEWERTFPRGIFSEAWSLDRTIDGGFAVFGSTVDILDGISNTDMYLVKTDGAGYSAVGSLTNNLSQLSVFPNPATDRIRLDAGKGQLTSVTLLDISGAEVIRETYNAVSVADLGVRQYSNGTYLLVATLMDGGVCSQPIVISH